MVELTTVNVNHFYNVCAVDDDGADTITVDGIVVKHLFSKSKIEANAKNIREMLSQLPDKFFKTIGGGWSFLNGCTTDSGVLWTGEHQMMDKLFSLGKAAGYVKDCLPRDMWSILPGGMPYYVVDLNSLEVA